MDEVAGDREPRRKRWLMVAGREVDLRVGRATGLTEDVREPQCALAEPVAKHRDVTVAEVDDAPFGRDEPRP